MSKHEFTPGPWFNSFSPDYFPNGATVIRSGDKVSGLVICAVTKLPREEANANLIAAAPELFRACERFVNGVEAHADEHLKNRMSGHISFMKEAINKALGETK